MLSKVPIDSSLENQESVTQDIRLVTNAYHSGRFGDVVGLLRHLGPSWYTPLLITCVDLKMLPETAALGRLSQDDPELDIDRSMAGQKDHRRHLLLRAVLSQPKEKRVPLKKGD